MAGWKTEQIYNAMPGMLDLSVASGADLARTADIVSDNMTAMGLNAGTMIKTGANLNREVEASSHFMDVYAYALTHSNVTLESLGETMKYAAPIANAYGASLEDAAAMTMIMGNAGIKGSMAGTALRMGLLRLSGPPKKASKEMDELGISMSDATKMAYETQAQLEALGISFDDNAAPADKMFQVLTQLSEKTKNLSREEKLAAVSAIFGANAASGWVNILDQGPEVFQQFRNELRECDGYAKSTADTMADNLAGAMTGLESAVESVGLAVGSAFLPALTEAAKGGAELIRSVGVWISEHEQLVQVAGKAALALGGVIVAGAGINLLSSGVAYVTTGYQLLANRIMATSVAQRIFTAEQVASHTAISSLTWSQIGANVKNSLVGAYNAVIARASAARASVLTFYTQASSAGFLTTAANGVRAFAASLGSAAMSAMRLAFSPVGVALMAIGAAGYYAYTHWEQVGPVFATLLGPISTAASTVASTLTPAFSSAANSAMRLGPAISAVGAVVLPIFLAATNVVIRFAATMVTTIAQAVATVANLFAGLGGAMASLLAGDFSGAASRFVDTMGQAFSDIKATGAALFEGLGDTYNHAFDPVKMLEFQEARAAQREGASAAQINALNSAPVSAPMSDDPMFAQAGQQVQQLGDSAGQAAQSVQQVSQNTQATADSGAQMQQAIQQATQEITNLQTPVQTITPQIDATNQSITVTNPQVQQLGTISQSSISSIEQLASAASSAGSSLGQLDGAVSSVASSLSAKAAEIGSIKISVPQVTSTAVAANAEGGIYKQGAFLTTFAEKSPEAAIPINKSRRAVELWEQTGAMLGQLPQKPVEYDQPRDELGNYQNYAGSAENLVQQGDLSPIRDAKIAKQREEMTNRPALAKQIEQTQITPVKQEVKQIEQAWQVETDYLGNLIGYSGSAENLVQQGDLSPIRDAKIARQREEMTQIKQAEQVKQIEQIKQAEPVKPLAKQIESTPEPAKPLPERLARSRSGRALMAARQRQGAKSTSILSGVKDFTNKTAPLSGVSPIGSQFPQQNPLSSLTGALANPLSNLTGIMQNPLVKLTGTFQNPLSNLTEALQKPQTGESETPRNPLADLISKVSGSLDFQPTINVQVTVQGNADKQVMEEAGQKLTLDIRREMSAFMKEMERNRQRTSYV